jgi:tRNA1Val (adenine37-N6)-methyltransferase
MQSRPSRPVDPEAVKRLGKATDVFYFKQFSIRDDRSTMKVGTDAVLLGIAADVAGAKSILEVGTGSGVIAMILAQRSDALIDAIDVDQDSVRQARENVASSPWPEQINIIHSSLQEFTPSNKRKYDLVISNPPFFSGSYKSHQKKRNIARHNEQLTFDELIENADKLLHEAGNLWVILPVKESLQFIDIAEYKGFYVQYILKIIPKAGKDYNRLILRLNREETDNIAIKTLTHWQEDGKWTPEYIKFTREFYIDF